MIKTCQTLPTFPTHPPSSSAPQHSPECWLGTFCTSHLRQCSSKRSHWTFSVSQNRQTTAERHFRCVPQIHSGKLEYKSLIKPGNETQATTKCCCYRLQSNSPAADNLTQSLQHNQCEGRQCAPWSTTFQKEKLWILPSSGYTVLLPGVKQ